MPGSRQIDPDQQTRPAQGLGTGPYINVGQSRSQKVA